MLSFSLSHTLILSLSHTHTHTNTQLRYINDQWDKDYREHEEVFRRFRDDSRRAQSENESFIATLKEGKEQLLEQIRDLQYELDRSRKEAHRIQQQQQVSGYQNGISPRRLKDLEEENAFLRTQVCKYAHMYIIIKWCPYFRTFDTKS